MPCKHVDGDFIFPEAKNKKYQVMIVIKFGSVEVAVSEFFPQFQQLRSWLATTGQKVHLRQVTYVLKERWDFAGEINRDC
jgi:hypothetical protein